MLNTGTGLKQGAFTLDKTAINYCYLVVGLLFLVRLFFIGKYNLLVEEAYYWNYAQHFDFGYLDHPPMVAVLIKITTFFFGSSEFGVRISALFCWILTVFFSYKLTYLLNVKASQYVVVILSMLPFYFLQSLVITPDVSLLLGWSGALYCLYRCLVLNEAKFWYGAGFFLGIGMLSKYSIVLLGPATILYMCVVPAARQWFVRKESYLCVLIVALMFTPVIYWNATHEWASFVFQGARRFNEHPSFSLHFLVLLLFVFIMPLGVFALIKLASKRSLDAANLSHSKRRFLQIFTFLPLIFFAAYSCKHSIKLNWICPGLLAVLPWIAIQMTLHKRQAQVWLITAFCMFIGYTYFLNLVCYRNQSIIPPVQLIKLSNWDQFTLQFHSIAAQIEKETNQAPVFVPMDLYNTASELSYYQYKNLMNGEISQSYPVSGGHVVGQTSLMHRYWTKREDLIGKTLIIISVHPEYLESPEVVNHVQTIRPIGQVTSYTQGKPDKIQIYYYKVGVLKD